MCIAMNQLFACLNKDEGENLGSMMARKLQQRLMELQAASCLTDISRGCRFRGATNCQATVMGSCPSISNIRIDFCLFLQMIRYRSHKMAD